MDDYRDRLDEGSVFGRLLGHDRNEFTVDW